ncbi:MAG: hypothetical protein Q9159_006135 [Coniocarpon cinnabarinum]
MPSTRKKPRAAPDDFGRALDDGSLMNNRRKNRKQNDKNQDEDLVGSSNMFNDAEKDPQEKSKQGNDDQQKSSQGNGNSDTSSPKASREGEEAGGNNA